MLKPKVTTTILIDERWLLAYYKKVRRNEDKHGNRELSSDNDR